MERRPGALTLINELHTEMTLVINEPIEVRAFAEEPARQGIAAFRP